jgi:hypothetical protein
MSCKWRVETSLGSVEVSSHSGGEASESDDSTCLLRALVRDFRYRDPRVRRAVADIVAQLRGRPEFDYSSLDLGDPRADAIGNELLRAARAGTLVARRIEPKAVLLQLGDGTAEQEEVLGPDPKPVEDLSWIGVELLGEDGSPIAAEAYRIKLPDGSVREGRLGSNGRAIERGIAPGQCVITFPELDREGWAD